MSLKTRIFNRALPSGATFSRAAATVDDLGVAVASGAPRYSPARLISSAPAWANMVNTAEAQRCLGIGYAADGSPRLAFCLLANANRTFYVYSDATTIVTQRNLVRTGEPTYTIDLLAGLANARDYYRYRPVSGTYCYGLLMVLCQRWHDTAEGGTPSWVAEGMSVLYSQDDGATFDYLDVDASSLVGNGPEGAYYSMQTYYPHDPTPGITPLDVWFTGGDYRQNPSSPGGQTFILRATRPTAGGTWTVQTPIAFSITEASKHIHCCGVVTKPSLDVVDLIEIWGDGQGVSEIVRRRCTVPSAYTDAENWTEQRDFHGLRASSQVANQAVSCCVGPDKDSLLLTTDEFGSQIEILHVPDSISDKAEFEHVYGWYNGQARFNACFWVHTARPELRQEFFALNDHGGGGGVEKDAENARVIASLDGRAWGEISPAPNALSSISGMMVGRFGSDLVVLTPASKGGIWRTPVPTMRSVRPLRLSPGGTELTATATVGINGAGWTVTECSYTNGQWINPYTSEPFDPQPPVGTNAKVYRVVSTGATTNGWQFNVGAIGAASQTFMGWFWLPPSQSWGPNNTQVLWVGAPYYGHNSWISVNNIGNTGAWTGYLVQNQVAARAIDYCIAFGPAVLVRGGGAWPLARNTADQPNEVLQQTIVGLGAEWTIGTMLLAPWDGWDTLLMANRVAAIGYVVLGCIYGDADNYILVKHNAHATTPTLTLEVVSGGSAAGTITINGVWLNRAGPIRLVVSQSDSAIEVSVHGPCLLATGTLAATLAVQPTEWRNGDASHANISSFDLVAVASDTVYSDATARAAILTGTGLVRGKVPARGIGPILG